MENKKYILGVETTAHTFGVAVLDMDGNILSNVRDMYTTEEGGMIPLEVRAHHKRVAPELYEKALVEAVIKPEEIEVIAFSNAPGLAPCLIEGMCFVKDKARELGIPIIPVNHCVAHLEIGSSVGATDPVMLYASGANTQIVAYESGKYRVFGETLDLGVGNFIDTFARVAGLGFPGGPKIQKLAEEYENASRKNDNVILLHGSNRNDIENMKKYNLPEQNKRYWFSWIKQNLEKKGIVVFTPLMSENWNPDYEKWKAEFEKINVNKNSVLIGHSAGGSFLVRWLGETGKKIKKLILVAPAIAHSLEDNSDIEEFYKFKINKEIKNNVEEIILFESSDDSDGLLKAGEIFSEELGINPIILQSRGHFTNRGDGKNMVFFELLDKIIEFPELIDLPYSIKGMDVAFSGLQTKLKTLLDKGEDVKKLSYSMQEVVFAMLVEAAERALAHTGKRELLLGGGVACNSRLQEMCKKMCEERGVKFFCPPRPLLVDNAGMIGYLGLKMYEAGVFEKDLDSVDIDARQRTDEVEVTWR